MVEIAEWYVSWMCHTTLPPLSIPFCVDKHPLLVNSRFQRKRHGHGVPRKGISLTLKPLPRKALMLRKLSNA
jgi:hypothetical protein